MLELLLPEVKDTYVRENFQRVQNLHDQNPLMRGQWVMKEYEFIGAVTNQKVPHGLSFQPKDVLLTRITGVGTITLNHDKFDLTNLDFTTTGPCVVRLLVGTLL
jgi:hypothetical protein